MSQTPTTGTATDFANMSLQEKLTWARSLWKVARNASFIHRFAGTSQNSMVQRITELKKSSQGHRAVIQLVADLQDDGVAGDAELLGKEEGLRAFDEIIQIDQLRHANRNTGRMSDQKSTIDFRNQSKDKLAHWIADRIDQMAFLTLSGISYDNKLNGAARVGSALPSLGFASDVSAPTTNRRAIVNSAGEFVPGVDNTSGSFGSASKLTWASLVDAHAYAKEQYIRGIRSGSEELYHVFLTPTGMSQLKQDPDFLANVRSAGMRGGKNPLFAGASSVMVDGMMIHEQRYVYDTRSATGGNKFGAGGDVDGQRILMCGAQALGLADIGAPYWDEEVFDYGNSYGISVGKIFGMLKPQFNSDHTGQTEDFGVLTIDTAL